MERHLLNTYRKKILVVIIVLMLAAAACNLPDQQNQNASEITPLTPQQSQQFEQNLQETLTSSEAGSEVALVLEEAELNAYLAAQLARQNDQTIRNPRVRMTGGRMEITADITQVITMEAKAVVVPATGSDGRPRLRVESVNVGSIPVPEGFVSQIQRVVDTLLVDYLADSGVGMEITSLEITEGQLIVRGIAE